MNPLIKEQLNKVKNVKLPEYNDSTTEMIIKKSISIELEVDKCYIIELEDYILNPPDNFTLHINWNKNIVPKYKYMIVQIDKIMGKMIKVSGSGYDINAKNSIPYFWDGWLTDESITVIERVD